MASDATKLTAELRELGHSRSVRRLRKQGIVPGVVYGAGKDPVPFQVDGRELRTALQAGGAVIELKLGGETQAVVLKDRQRHPVTGETLHVDLLRVRLDKPIQATVPLELVGADEAPGVIEGGVLEHVTREITVEALPTAIPDVIEHDVSAMQVNDTVTLEAVTAPEGVTIVDDPETTVATVTPPRLAAEEEEIETETELVGEGGESAAEAQAQGATGDEAESAESSGEGE